MSRNSNRNSVNVFQSSNPPVTTTPLTLACWYKPASVAHSSQMLINLRVAAENTAHRYSIEITTDKLWALVRDATQFGLANILTPSMVVNTWYHCVGIFTSSTLRRAVLDGDWANSATDSNNRSPDPSDQIQIGRRHNVNTPVDGSIEDVAIWNAALNQADVELLATGVSPTRVKRQNLKYYPQFRLGDSNGDEIDLIAGLPTPQTGTFTIDESPPKVVLKRTNLLVG